MLGAGQWVEHDVRRDLYAHLETLSPAFYLTHGTGDLISRATNDGRIHPLYLELTRMVNARGSEAWALLLLATIYGKLSPRNRRSLAGPSTPRAASPGSVACERSKISAVGSEVTREGHGYDGAAMQ